MKQFLLPFATCLTLFIQSGAIASETAFPAIKCYIFQGEQLAIENTCITESETRPDGGFMTLTWENGATTLRSFGKQPQGSETCPNLEDNIDGFCGKPYLRHSTTFQQVSRKEADQLQKEEKAIQCIQLQKRSICWKP
jgi:hypothetical protein